MSRSTRRRSPGSLALPLIVACQLMVTLDATVVNVALLPIRRALGFAPASLDWVIDAYSLAFGGFLLLGGRAGDVLGRRRILSLGVALFTLGSLAAGLSPSAAVLVSARALQGLGAALAAPNALGLLTVIAPEGPARARALGAFTAASAAGGSLGLVLGGALTSWVSWRAAFFVNVPVGVLVLALIPRHLPSPPRARGPVDLLGALVGTAGLVGVIDGLVDLAERARPAMTLASLGAGVALLGALVAVERRSAAPMLAPAIVRDRRRVVVLAVMLLVGVALYGSFYLTAQYVEGPLRFSPVTAGVSFLPLSVAIVAASRLAPRLVARRGPVATLLAGVATLVVGGAWLAAGATSASYLAALLGPLVLLGAGAGLAFPAISMIALGAASPGDSGTTAGLLQTMQQVGTSAGVAVLGVLVLVGGRRLALGGACAALAAALVLATLGLTAIGHTTTVRRARERRAGTRMLTATAASAPGPQG